MCFSDCGLTQTAAGGVNHSGCSSPLLQHSECEGVNGAGWVENNAPCSWNPGKGWLYPRAQPSQASLKLLDLLSILLILKENKLHKWDRWFLFVMTVAPPRPSQLSSRISPDVFFCSEMLVLCNRSIPTWTPGPTPEPPDSPLRQPRRPLWPPTVTQSLTLFSCLT